LESKGLVTTVNPGYIILRVSLTDGMKKLVEALKHPLDPERFHQLLTKIMAWLSSRNYPNWK